MPCLILQAHHLFASGGLVQFLIRSRWLTLTRNHPLLHFYLFKEILGSGQEAASVVFGDVLLANGTNANLFAVRIGDDCPENLLKDEADEPSVVCQSPMAHVRKGCFGTVHEIVNLNVILWNPAEDAGTGLCVNPRLSHV